MRILALLLRVFVFFTLFSFAVNNRHDAAVKWFFGFEWRAPMVFIVLAAFALGCAFGGAAMLPSWWRHRRTARLLRPSPIVGDSGTVPLGGTSLVSDAPLTHPPRDGL